MLFDNIKSPTRLNASMFVSLVSEGSHEPKIPLPLLDLRKSHRETVSATNNILVVVEMVGKLIWAI